jgi:NADH-quinone oxidoreductase subunit J
MSGWIPSSASIANAGAPASLEISNTAALGQVLYTKYLYFFQAAGLILLTAMIGAIVLTLSHKPNVKRQSIAAQNARDRHESVELKKTPSRAGV